MSDIYSKKATLDFFTKPENLKEYSDVDSFRTGEREVYEKYFPKGGILLDLGCGGGRVSFLMKDHFKKIIGLDIHPKLIESAKSKSNFNNLEFVVGDATKLDYPDDLFDSVSFSHNGIEGMRSDELINGCLKEVFRVLKPGGRFIFSTHTLFTRHYLGQHIKNFINTSAGLIPLIPKPYMKFNELKLRDVFIEKGGAKLAWRISNPFSIVKKLKNHNFKIVYVNSCDRIINGKSPSFSSKFNTHEIYYVVEKP